MRNRIPSESTGARKLHQNFNANKCTYHTVKVHIKTRIITVEGPRGKLTKDLSHLAVSFSHPKKDLIHIELHHGSRKNVATLRTVRTIINNLITGVTKGFRYKMRYVYAHFPINVNIDKNAETGLFQVEIRYVITIGRARLKDEGMQRKFRARTMLTRTAETSWVRRSSAM